MSFRATALKRSLLACLLLGILSVPAISQVKNSPVVFSERDGITTSLVMAPSNGGTLSVDTPQWLQVELHYHVTLQPGQGDYLPEVQFKVWVEGRDLLAVDGKPGVGVAVGFTGDINYVNVKQGQDRYAVFYVHPSTLGRYNAGGGTDDFLRKFNVHAEAYVSGALVDYFNKNPEKDLDWFKGLRPLGGLVFHQNQCSFMLSNPDRYPAIKLSDAGGGSPLPAPTPAPEAPATPAPAPTPTPAQ